LVLLNHGKNDQWQAVDGRIDPTVLGGALAGGKKGTKGIVAGAGSCSEAGEDGVDGRGPRNE